MNLVFRSKVALLGYWEYMFWILVRVLLGSYWSNFLSRKSLTASQKEAIEKWKESWKWEGGQQMLPVYSPSRPIPSPCHAWSEAVWRGLHPPPPFTTAQHGLWCHLFTCLYAPAPPLSAQLLDGHAHEVPRGLIWKRRPKWTTFSFTALWSEL